MSMGKLIKATSKVCLSCKYHMGFGSQPGKEQKDAGHFHNIACNYLDIAGHSRVLTPDGPLYDVEYCDKYEPGVEIVKQWTADSMTIWAEESEKRQKWKELEDARRKGISDPVHS